MAVTAIDYKSEQAVKIYNNEPGGAKANTPLPPDDFYGKVRVFRGYFKNTTGGDIAANKVISVTKLPAGRILPMSTLYHTALGSGVTLDVGYNVHKNNTNGTAIDADIDAILDGADVAAAGSKTVSATNIQGITLNGQAEITAKILGAVMPANAELSFVFFVVVD